jgi:polyisoprenyl-teichoic acid--peptidoglycan teichoic acid transferase
MRHNMQTLMKKLNPNRLWITKGLGVFVAVTYLVAAFSVIRLGVIPTKFLFALILLSLLVSAAVAIITYRHKWAKTWKTVLLIILSLLVSLGNIGAIIAANGAYSFLGKVQEQGCSETEYSIIAKKDPVVTLKDNNRSIAYIQDDANNTAVLKTEKTKTDATPQGYADLSDVTTALDQRASDSAVIRTSYLSLLQDNNPTFYQDITVLSTFKVTGSCSNTKQANINKPYVVYISGIDTYGDVASVSRSDVNILMVVNPQTHKTLLVNTPRDYYVQLHNTTGVKDKLTHAGIYGIDTSEQTMEDLYGTKIDYYLRINFTSLTSIVDALGGVTVNSDQAFTAGKYNFVAGPNNLDGQSALAFSRERHAFADGDRQRGKDQQEVISAIINKSNNPQTILKYQQVLKVLNGTFQTDASRNTITSILNQQTNSLGQWQVTSISVDGTDSRNVTYSMGDQVLYVMEPNQASVDAAKAQIQAYLK